MIAAELQTPPPAAAHAPASRPLELQEARQHRDALENLLRREQAAMAEFLVALADFDQRRGWEPLGHASLFAFLRVELRLCNSAACYRKSAARLLQRFPGLTEPLGDGRLCLSTTAELAKVLTEGNWAEVAPRFFGLSAREAQEVVAELQPRQAPATRAVVTRVASAAMVLPLAVTQSPFARSPPAPVELPAMLYPNEVPLTQLLTSEVANGGDARPVTRRDQVEPLTADLRRLHITFSRRFLRDLDVVRGGLSHAIPNATTEQVLQVALQLLLERQARARGLVKRPRKAGAATALAGTPTSAPTVVAAAPSAPAVAAVAAALSAPAVAAVAAAVSAAAAAGTGAARPGAGLAASEAGGGAADETTEAPRQTAIEAEDEARFEPQPPRRTGPREAIPATVRRAVWARDGSRCSWPLDGGGRCGSTHRLELDHVVPWAAWGGATEANLRVVCSAHNRLAARRAFGSRCVERYAVPSTG